MDYISAIEASEKWGVSLRQVQRLLAENRIPLAKKYGRSWMIPCEAEKPTDPRIEKKLPKLSLSEELSSFIASTAIPMPSNNPDGILDSMDDERLRIKYECELSYLRGDFKRALNCFRKAEGEEAAKLCASYVAVAAAISLGDHKAYIEIEEYLKRCMSDDRGSNVSTVAELALSAVYVSVIAPNMAPNWLKDGDFSDLVPKIRPTALYLRAKYFQCIGKYEAILIMTQTALSLSELEDGITLTDIYLRMACAVACYCLEQRDEAKRWLLEVMTVALPHGFITPFAENVPALGGLVEQCLEQEFPQYYDAVIGQCERTWKNWVTFHNLFTKDNITLILSLREYHIALLVAHRVPYAEIAKQYNISVGRLKNIMLDIYGKLFISGRDELAKYVF